MSERFTKWCAMTGNVALPASPLAVAMFIHDSAGIVNADTLHAELVELDHAMESLGYSPAARSSVALRAFSDAYETPLPRSWPKDAKDQWDLLPWGIKKIIEVREQQRDVALSRAQNEAAELRKKLRKYEDGSTKQTETAV